MQVNLSLLQTDFRTNHVSVMPGSEIKTDGQYMRPFSVLRYSDGNTFKYPYSEHLSRHRRSADDFFDDNSNVAMYIVAPLLFLVFGSCCGIYGCYKCREYISENNSVANVKKKISSFKNFITGKKEKSPKDKFLEQLNERDRPSTAQSLKNSGNMYVIESHEELRSVMSTPGISYFPDNQLYGKLSSFGSTLDYSQSSPLSNGTDSTIISCAVSIESHPFEIISQEPKEKQNVEAKFSSHATGKASYVKQRDMHCGKSPDSPKNKQVVFLAPTGGKAVSINRSPDKQDMRIQKSHLNKEDTVDLNIPINKTKPNKEDMENHKLNVNKENTDDLNISPNKTKQETRPAHVLEWSSSVMRHSLRYNDATDNKTRSYSITSDYDSEKQLNYTELSQSLSSNCSSRLANTDIYELQQKPTIIQQSSRAPRNDHKDIPQTTDFDLQRRRNLKSNEIIIPDLVVDEPPPYTPDGRTYYKNITSKENQQSKSHQRYNVQNGQMYSKGDVDDYLVNSVSKNGYLSIMTRPNNLQENSLSTMVSENRPYYDESKPAKKSKYEIFAEQYIQYAKEKKRRKKRDSRIVDYWR